MKLTDSFVVNRTTIQVALADIVAVDAEVVVNSVCDLLHFGSGVSGAFSRAGGPAVRRSLLEVAAGRHVTAGDILVASAGTMPFRYIFHAISSICTSGTTGEILTRCVRTCLVEARARSLHTIAFPALGTGQMGFDVREAAAILINSVVDDVVANGGLERIVFCLLEPDAFTSFFRQAVRRSILLGAEDKRVSDVPASAVPISSTTPLDAAAVIMAHPVGLEHSARYGSLVVDLLSRLFVPPLSQPVPHGLPQGPKQIEPAFYVTYPNFADAGFWRVMDQRFQASQLHVICVNSPLSTSHGMDRLLTRLRSGYSGKFGLLIGRGTESLTPTAPQIDAFRREGIVTIALNDFDISQLARQKSIGQPAETYLEAKLTDLSLVSEDPDADRKTNAPRKVFVGYAPEDSEYLRRFEKSVRLLEIQGLLELWSEANLLPGSPRQSEVREHLDAADVITCLMSPDLLASGFCFSEELMRALGRSPNTVSVIPIVVRPCEWNETPLGALQAVPVDGGSVVPITRWSDPDTAWLNVAQQFRKLLQPAAS